MHHLPALLGIFGGAFVVGLSGAMMPGPLLAVTISESSRRGAKAGPMLVIGHMILESALVAAVAMGLTAFLHNRLLVSAIGLVGGLVMGWMGLDMILAVRRGMTLASAAATPGRLHPVTAGIVVSLSNPYWTIWWITIGLNYVMMSLRFGIAGLVTFFAGHILSDFAWYSLVSAGVARGRSFMTDRAYRGLILVCAAVMLAFAVFFLWTGVSQSVRGA